MIKEVIIAEVVDEWMDGKKWRVRSNELSSAQLQMLEVRK